MEEHRSNRLKVNLQLFGEKTEKPTPKKKQKAAQKGQLAMSPEINSVVVLLAVFLAVRAFTPYIIKEWTDLTSNLYKMSAVPQFNIDYYSLQTMFLMVTFSSTKMLAPIIGVAMVGGLAATYLQVGLRFDPSAVKFNLENIDPVAGTKKLFSSQALAEMVKSILKMIIIGYVAYAEYKKDFMGFTRLTDMNLQASSAFVGQVTMNVVFKVVLWLIMLAIADYIFQKWRTQKELKMSKEEIKQEHKEGEGDPQLKAKIRQKQRQMSMSRMMQAVPKADVVITNPTHFAVALKYDAQSMNAPVIIAKGQDRIALRIKELAGEHKIVIVENKPLAQSLFFSTEIGDAVPEDLFQAVAEVLAFVYKLKGKI